VEHEIDPDDPDAVAPGRVSLISVVANDLDSPGGCGASSSCDGTGTVSIVVQAEDDATPPESMGFRMELVSGSLPPGLSLPDGPVRGHARGDGSVGLILAWSPRADSMDFVVEVSAVDRAGNAGDPTPIAVVIDEGSGCSLGGDAPRPAINLLVAVLAAAFILRARRPASA
jgi:hypothetical protein